MNTTTTRKLAAALSVTAALGAGAAALASTASADTSTDLYLAQLHAHGYESGRSGDAGLISAGLTACHNLDAGASLATVVYGLQAANPELTSYDAGYIVGTAISALCPRNSYLIPTTGGQAA